MLRTLYSNYLVGYFFRLPINLQAVHLPASGTEGITQNKQFLQHQTHTHTHTQKERDNTANTKFYLTPITWSVCTEGMHNINNSVAECGTSHAHTQEKRVNPAHILTTDTQYLSVWNAKQGIPSPQIIKTTKLSGCDQDTENLLKLSNPHINYSNRLYPP